MSRSMSARLAREARQITKAEESLTREERLLRDMKKTDHGPVSAINRKRRPVNLADELPEEYLFDRSFRLFILQNLAWDYIETILDVCAQQKRKETKPLARTIRELHRRYDIFRSAKVDSDHTEAETNAALLFEQGVAEDLRRFHNSVGMDSSRIDLTERARVLISAVQDAMLLLDAVKVYARILDCEIADMGIWTCDCCLVQDEILRLYPLIPLFGGDCYEATSGARDLSARIIVNRLRDIKINLKHREDNPDNFKIEIET